MDPPPDNALMDPKEGDYVRFKPKRESTGTVIKRSGTRIRVQPKDGGATLWKELSELLPLASAVDEVSEALGPVRPDACDDGDDTNLDDIDDVDDAVAVAAQSAQAAEAEAEAAEERLTGMVRVRGGGCAASKPRAQAEPFIQDLDGPPRSSSLAVEQGTEATPEDVKVAESVPETTDSARTEVVEPRAQAEPFIQNLDGPPRSPSLTVEQGAEATPKDVKVAEPVPETTVTAPTSRDPAEIRRASPALVTPSAAPAAAPAAASVALAASASGTFLVSRPGKDGHPQYLVRCKGDERSAVSSPSSSPSASNSRAARPIFLEAPRTPLSPYRTQESNEEIKAALSVSQDATEVMAVQVRAALAAAAAKEAELDATREELRRMKEAIRESETAAAAAPRVVASAAEAARTTYESGPTKDVEPAAGAATEAETAPEAETGPAEALAETRNPTFEIGSSIIDVIVQAFTPRGPSSSGPSSSADALSVRNVHRAILEADNSPRQPMVFRTTMDGCALLPPKLHQALSELDTILIKVLLSGAIRLLRVEWLMKQLDNFKMQNRQALEELEKSGVSPSPLLSGEEAAALVRRGDRSIGALTYGWLSPGDPDPKGSRFRVLRRALMGMAIRIEALFWDFGSLYQAPRTPEQSASFKLALEGGAMNQLYASILATTVLQIEEIPPRPAEFDGVVCLFKLSANVDENMVRAVLTRFGTIESCDLGRTPPIVRFASHASAIAAKNAGAPPGLCEGLDTLYNETPYLSRGW